ncbi:hypothetical protein CCHL11_02772 [Colletotrichum chlorophyti]|uniref:Cytochrome P450 n=1 Tax=Colletotrichum chlorophyti TaxID=708187 RepID=A0A1Q8S2W0_9PEZI|nr:hypothetical protein CCHL11_02772 [Colletotrichum chlorophyti]
MLTNCSYRISYTYRSKRHYNKRPRPYKIGYNSHYDPSYTTSPYHQSLRADVESLRLIEVTLELVFGHGKWKCLGRNVAIIELQKVFVELLQRYDLVLCDPTKPRKSLNYGIFLQS